MSGRFFIVVVAGIAVGAFSWIGMGGGLGSFGPWSPFPAVTVLPSLVGSVLAGGNKTGYTFLRYVFPAVIGPALFFGWNLQLFRGVEKVPRRSWIGLIVLTGLTIYFFVSSWTLGIKYQGLAHTTTVAAVNAFALGVCWSLLLLAHRRPSFGRSLLFHWMTTVWLVWVAFPLLGESL